MTQATTTDRPSIGEDGTLNTEGATDGWSGKAAGWPARQKA